MQLIYRGHTYPYTSSYRRTTVQRRVINWRYRLPGQPHKQAVSVQIPLKPRVSRPIAINWRYQVSIA